MANREGAHDYPFQRSDTLSTGNLSDGGVQCPFENAGVSHTLEALEHLFKEKPDYKSERDLETLIDAVASACLFFVPTLEEMLQAMRIAGLQPHSNLPNSAPQEDQTPLELQVNPNSEVERAIRGAQRAPRTTTFGGWNFVQQWVATKGKVPIADYGMYYSVRDVGHRLRQEGYIAFDPPIEEVEEVLGKLIDEVELAENQHKQRRRQKGRSNRVKRKQSRVEPVKLPKGFGPRYWALFKSEYRQTEKNKKSEQCKVTCSPKTLRSFEWREEGGHWEKSKHLFGSFEEAVKAYEENKNLFDGYGYVLEPDVPISGTDGLYLIVTDLDRCRNPQNGNIEPWAMEIVETQDTFTEISPSGTGLHSIGLGEKKRRSKMVFRHGDHKVENYGGNVGKRRFMTYTGVPLAGYNKPLANESVQRWIDENVPVKESENKGPTINYSVLSPDTYDVTRDKIVRICEGIKHEDRGDLFRTLYHEGDYCYYSSRSEAEIALLNILAWATRHMFEDEYHTKQAIKDVFEASSFYRTNHRDQWDREGYIDGQIDQAIADCTSGYTGKPKEQILKQLEALRIAYNWASGGRDNANARAAYGAHLALAYDHGWYVRAGEVVQGPRGEWYPIPETGILVHSPVRGISLLSRVRPSEGKHEKTRDYRNITKLNDWLEDEGLIKRIYKGVHWGSASLFLLPKSPIDSHRFSHLFSPSTHKQEPQGFLSPQLKDSCGSGLCVSGENILQMIKLNWTKNLTSRQKFVIEQVSWGRKTFKDLAGFFEGDPKHLRYKVINPLLKQKILSEAEDGYEVDVQGVNRVFIESGGEELLNKEVETIEYERAEHRGELEQRGDKYEPGAIRATQQTNPEEQRVEAALREDLTFRLQNEREQVKGLRQEV